MKIPMTMLGLIALAACGGTPAEDPMPGNASDVTDADIIELPGGEGNGMVAGDEAAVTDWTGRWTGVEGTFLDVAPDEQVGPDHYRLTMQYTLDDRGTFPGVAEGDTIRFTRPDGDKVLTRTDGDATGLKYLAGKQDCVTVRPGEGYCRD